jgi:glycine hydroxymethyltransferase
VPAITTRGMKENEMETVVDLIDQVLMNIDNESRIASVQKKVHRLMNEFPLYAELGFQ